MTIQILDIYYGNKFDAAKEKATGTDGVIIKAGQGSYQEYIAKQSHYIEECEKVGLPWGVYWLVDARINPIRQKAAIKESFPTGNFGKLGMWLDIEKPLIVMPDTVYRMLPYAYFKPIESIIQMLIETYDIKPGIYTSKGAFDLILSGAGVAKIQWLSQFPLWTAQYNKRITKPDLYGAWTRWFMWQYQGEPDYSIFNGTDEDFKAWTGSNSFPDPDSEPTPVPPVFTYNQAIDDSIALHNQKHLEALNALEALKK